MKLTPMGKIVTLILVVGLAAGVWKYWNKLAPDATQKGGVVPMVGKLPPISTGQGGVSKTGTFAPAGEEPGCTSAPEVRLLGYAWNAQMGMLLATGGPQATEGSLMCKHGVNFKWSRQDDNSKLQEALIAFATELKSGSANPSKGAHFVTIMGDGSAAFIKPLNDTLKKLGPQYKARIVDAIGYSRGEDKFMGPAAWRQNPSASKGGVVAGVLRDGDWNIAQKWLSDNGLKTNPDEKTWDPDALNWIGANDYLDAAQKYITGYTETRPVVRNGHKTGETKTIGVDGVVTWTPGDVNIAKNKGGLVSIISTQEYTSQMPCVVIGINQWCQQNRGLVENMIQAIGEGSREIQNSNAALKHGADISSLVYKEDGAGPDYWEKYFNVQHEADKTGVSVDLGGSSVNNLADSLLAFGLIPGSANLVATTYSVFGNLVVSQYPELVSSIDPAGDVVDGSYLSDIQRKMSAGQITKVQPIAPVYHPKPGNVVSRRQWDIQFDAGKATFTPSARAQLYQLGRDLLIAGGTVVEVHGHTDNAGDPRKSLPLSNARAYAVKSYLEHLSPVNFPPGRVRAFAHGETQPLVPNTSMANRAKNRRVEVVLRAG